MTDILYYDTETRSRVDLKKRGGQRYVRDPSTELLMVQWAFNDGPVHLWDRYLDGGEVPKEVVEAMNDPRVLKMAHNISFDRPLTRRLLDVDSPSDQWHCTMAQAYAHGFPGSLGELCTLLDAPRELRKLAGTALINKFCTPACTKTVPKGAELIPDMISPAGIWYWRTAESHPEDWEEFRKYAINDIHALRWLYDKLPRWNLNPMKPDSTERRMFVADHRMNQKGVPIDMDLARAGVRMASEEKAELERDFRRLTRTDEYPAGVKPTQRKILTEKIVPEKWGVEWKSTAKNELAYWFQDNPEAPEELKQIAHLLEAANKTSTAKFVTAVDITNDDGILREMMQFCGAARTGRFAGRGLQVHNLPSRGLPPQKSTDAYIGALLNGTAALFYDKHTWRAAAAIRGLIKAPPGYTFITFDWSNIEGRTLVQESQEHWKLEAFRKFDFTLKEAARLGCPDPEKEGYDFLVARGFDPDILGHDLYKIMASKITGTPVNKIVKAIRNSFGKVSELAFGYAGGVGAGQTFAKAYGVKFGDNWETIQQSMPAAAQVAQDNYDQWGHERRGDLPLEDWLATEAVKVGWRSAHPRTVQYWFDVVNAACDALRYPGQTFRVNEYIAYKAVKHRGVGYLACQLPSGRVILYSGPELTEDGKSFHYWGKDTKAGSPTNGKWVRMQAYHGILVENITQAIARDILVDTILRLIARGFDVRFHVHDEVIIMIKEAEAEAALPVIQEIAETPPEWFSGIPLAVDMAITKRYRK